MAAPIVEQLEKQGYALSEPDANRIQGLVDAVNMVKVHGLFPDAAISTAQKRLFKDVLEHAHPCVPPQEAAR